MSVKEKETLEKDVLETVEILEDDAEESLVVVFSKPYVFEGEIYNELDLSGLYDITGNDLLLISKEYSKGGNFSSMPEMDLSYAFLLAARVTKRPIEFFKGLPMKDCIKIKNKIMGFTFS